MGSAASALQAELNMTKPLPPLERVAMAIYYAAFRPKDEAEATFRKPSPGWCWEKTSEEQRAFCRKQAKWAIHAMLNEEFGSGQPDNRPARHEKDGDHR